MSQSISLELSDNIIISMQNLAEFILHQLLMNFPPTESSLFAL